MEKIMIIPLTLGSIVLYVAIASTCYGYLVKKFNKHYDADDKALGRSIIWPIYCLLLAFGKFVSLGSYIQQKIETKEKQRIELEEKSRIEMQIVMKELEEELYQKTGKTSIKKRK